MHVIVSEAIITIAMLIAATFVASIIITNTTTLDYLFKSNNENIKDKILVEILIIFAINNTNTSVKIWAKNIGLKEVHIDLIPKSDLFFGPKGAFERIPHETETSSLPKWNYTIVNNDGDSEWDPGETLEITVLWHTTLSSGDYFVKLVLYNGASSQYVFSI